MVRIRSLLCIGCVAILLVVGVVVISAPSPGDLSIQFYNGETPVGAPLRLNLFLGLGSWQYKGQTVTGFKVTATVGTTDPTVTHVRVTIWGVVHNAFTIVPVKNVSLLGSDWTAITTKTYTTPLFSLEDFLADCGIGEGQTCTINVKATAEFASYTAASGYTVRGQTATWLSPAIGLTRTADPVYTYTITVVGAPT